MTTISTGSRLHFGLFNAGGVANQPQFGGLGLMIDSPRVQVSVRSSESWQALGTEAERALQAARKVAEHLKDTVSPSRTSEVEAFCVEVVSSPPLHSGLGVGTQLAMAIGRAVVEELGISIDNEILARIVGRGLRSGIGVQGFHSGGFFFDHGRAGSEPSLVERIEWPNHWRILLVRPPVQASWFGSAELSAFARHRDGTSALQIESELRCLAREITSALKDSEFDAFGEQLFQFNRLAGEAFAEDQGGIYSSAAVSGIVEWFRVKGLRGVGQSSWGPTVFALVETQHANHWRDAAVSEFPSDTEIIIVDGANSGFVKQKW